MLLNQGEAIFYRSLKKKWKLTKHTTTKIDQIYIYIYIYILNTNDPEIIFDNS